MYYTVIFKPCSDQLYSHRCIDGVLDKQQMIFKTKGTNYVWFEKDILEYSVCKEITKEEYLKYINDITPDKEHDYVQEVIDMAIKNQDKLSIDYKFAEWFLGSGCGEQECCGKTEYEKLRIAFEAGMKAAE